MANPHPLPYTFEDLSEEEKSARAKLYTGPHTIMVDMVKAMPYGVYLPRQFTKIAESVYNFKVREDDVFMVSYPKAGSTWTQEMVWQIVHGFDEEEGKSNVMIRSPFLEMSMFSSGEMAAIPAANKEGTSASASLAEVASDSVGFTSRLSTSSPRVIKCHLPIEMLPREALTKARILWIARNPKDSVVSFNHHEHIMPPHGFTGTFEDTKNLYMRGEVLYGPYWPHLKSAWRLADRPNVQIIWFEDLKKDMAGQIRLVSDFLGANFPEERMDALVHHLAFDQFKNNPAVNHKPPKGSVPDEVRDNFNFIRKGKVGDWKEHFQGDALNEWDAWIEKNNVDPTVPIKYE